MTDTTNADDFLPEAPKQQPTEPAKPITVMSLVNSATSERLPDTGGQPFQVEIEPEDPDAWMHQVMNPLNGEVVELNDVDGLIDMLERLDEVNKNIYATMMRIRETLFGMTEGDAKTRRVRGERRSIKFTCPAESFTQADLKALWEAYPDLRDQYLKIAEIGVQLREYKKLVGTSGGERFTEFRDKLTKANRGIVGTPSFEIEK